jgi:hypothetical protein
MFQSTPQAQVFEQFHNALAQHCQDHHIVSSKPEAYSLDTNLPNLTKSMFRLLKDGNHRDGGQRLKDAEVETYQFTPFKLGKLVPVICNPDSLLPLLFFSKCSSVLDFDHIDSLFLKPHEFASMAPFCLAQLHLMNVLQSVLCMIF